jgi:hypothetical protein
VLATRSERQLCDHCQAERTADVLREVLPRHAGRNEQLLLTPITEQAKGFYFHRYVAMQIREGLQAVPRF